MFQETQNAEYLRTITNRVRHEWLTWCEQVTDILVREVPSPEAGSVLQDIGCNAGQLYKSLTKRSYPVEYRGYDIEQQYIDIARREFPELAGRLILANVETDPLPREALTVVSATLEHLADPLPALQRILQATNSLAVLRTFIGPESKSFELTMPGASRSYRTRQFHMDELAAVFAVERFNWRLVDDRYTASRPKEISSNVHLRQQILVLTPRTDEP
jgi:SAM-dependent methyltransferase